MTKSGVELTEPDPKNGRVRQADRRQASMDSILDNAEYLFAEHGYNGVTFAEVAKVANVDTALIRYYFVDKKQLFREVFTRRGPEINRLRLEAMARARHNGKNGIPRLADIVDAFMRPAFVKMSDDAGWANYMAIVSYVNSSRGILDELMSEVFDEVSREFLNDLRAIFPRAPEREIYWSYHLLTGAFTFSLGRTGRIDRLSDGLCSSSDSLAIADRLTTSLTVGISALCGQF